MALIQYRTTSPVQGDSLYVLLRKLSQSLGVPVDPGDNVYKTMWKILADQSWSSGTPKSYLNVGTKLISFRTLLPIQGDSLNVLFLKFYQRTGVLIPIQNHQAAYSALWTALDGGMEPGPGPGPDPETYTFTYTNDFGEIVGDAIQTVTEGEDGTPVEATTALDLTFDQWSDGVTDNPRTDTNASADITVSANWTEVELVGNTASEDFESYATGTDISGVNGGTGWWTGIETYVMCPTFLGYDKFDTYTVGLDIAGLNNTDGRFTEAWLFHDMDVGKMAEDFFETYTLDDSLNGLNGGDGYDGAWIVFDSIDVEAVATDTFESYTLDDSLNGLNGGDGFDGAWIVADAGV